MQYNEFLAKARIDPRIANLSLKAAGGCCTDEPHIELKFHYDHSGRVRQVDARQVTEFKVIFKVEGG